MTTPSPDCTAGKHAACVGEAWNDDHEMTTTCPCPCHHDSGTE